MNRLKLKSGNCERKRNRSGENDIDHPPKLKISKQSSLQNSKQCSTKTNSEHIFAELDVFFKEVLKCEFGSLPESKLCTKNCDTRNVTVRPSSELCWPSPQKSYYTSLESRWLTLDFKYATTNCDKATNDEDAMCDFAICFSDDDFSDSTSATLVSSTVHPANKQAHSDHGSKQRNPLTYHPDVESVTCVLDSDSDEWLAPSPKLPTDQSTSISKQRTVAHENQSAQSSTILECPLCLFSFPMSFTKGARDSHIAQCLDSENVDAW